MSIFSGFLQDLPMYLLSLPVLLMAFSVHESAHGLMAYRLGDPTAHNLGRITLNPVKHLDLLGTICMIVAHIGWAKPVPIQSRNFKNPKRDMALTGAAGPLSNLFLAILHLAALRVVMSIGTNSWLSETMSYIDCVQNGSDFTASVGYVVASLFLYMLYLGVIMNINLAIFNLIPVPPFDGSRIFYAFLPSKWYFGVMRYERYIMLAFLLLFAFGTFTGPLNWLLNKVAYGLLYVVGLTSGNDAGVLGWMLTYVGNLIA